MKKRVLGRTGLQLSVIGFGGIVVQDVPPAEAAKYVARAIDRGINYFDVAPSYGNAEERLGPALEPFRNQVFLACKTAQRLASDVDGELNRSLERLKTDHFDLYQLHGVSSVEEADRILAPGGALEALVAARKRGLIHHIGFSAHSEEAALRLLDAFPFDSVLFPINLFCWRDGAFGPQVCEKAIEKGTGILALKALAKRPLREGEQKKWPKCWYVPIDTAPEAKAAFSFTLSKPVTAALCPGHAELLWLACDIVELLDASPPARPQETNPQGKPLFENREVIQ
ncbi:MAG: aldo/keto reductase [Candidatus Latescibacterota bacterium]